MNFAIKAVLRLFIFLFASPGMFGGRDVLAWTKCLRCFASFGDLRESVPLEQSTLSFIRLEVRNLYRCCAMFACFRGYCSSARKSSSTFMPAELRKPSINTPFSYVRSCAFFTERLTPR